jgi:hypothetical protein
MAKEPGFKIRLEGFGEALFAMQAVAKYLEPQGGILTTMQKAMTIVHSFAFRNVHIISGMMRSTLHFGIGSSGNTLVGSERASVPYDKYEFTRPGTKGGTPHNTLAYTQASVGGQVTDLFANTLDQEVKIITSTARKA